MDGLKTGGGRLVYSNGMSIDERLQRLLQATQSLSADIKSWRSSTNWDDLHASINRLHASVEIDAQNIRRLAIIATGEDNPEDLGSLVDRLERKRKAKGGV